MKFSRKRSRGEALFEVLAPLQEFFQISLNLVGFWNLNGSFWRLWYAVEPGTLHNRSIVDLELAPRNAAGEVEFSADFFLLKPKDPARGNGAVLLEVPNRGQKYILDLFEAGRASLDPSDEADFDDGFLLKQGYTIAWLGWQADIAYPGDFLRLYSPVAKAADGSAISRDQYVARYAAAAQENVHERFMLREDFPAVMTRAALEWQLASQGRP